LRGEQDKLCALVIIGVNARGEKQFLAIEDGVRESTQSWREVLLSLKSRGVRRQSFWFQRQRELSEYPAHLVGFIMQRSCGVASAGFQGFCV